MFNFVEERAMILGRYIVENNATVRNAAKQFGVSKSTVHKDVSHRLKMFNYGLYKDVKSVLDTNKACRHIRGGMATKLKYEELKHEELKHEELKHEKTLT